MCYFVVSVITGLVKIYMYTSVKLEIVVYGGVVVVNGSKYDPIKHIIFYYLHIGLQTTFRKYRNIKITYSRSIYQPPSQSS